MFFLFFLCVQGMYRCSSLCFLFSKEAVSRRQIGEKVLENMFPAGNSNRAKGKEVNLCSAARGWQAANGGI